MTDQHADERTPLPTPTARYGSLDEPEPSSAEPELFPGEHAIARTKAGSRDEMRVIRRHYNWVNMVIALLACGVAVAVALMFAPQPQGEAGREVDHVEIAQNAQTAAAFPLAVPQVPAGDGWYANSATFSESGASAIPTWYVSWVDEDAEQWLSLRQVGEDAPETWSASYLEEFAQTGDSQLAGVEFSRYEGTGSSEHALTGETEGTIILVSGSSPWDQMEALAEDAVESVGAVQN